MKLSSRDRMRTKSKALLREVLILGIGAGTRILGSLLRRSVRDQQDEVLSSPSSFLVIRLDLLGDAVFSLSTARALKSLFPSARVTFLSLPQTAALLLLSPDVDDVICIDTNLIRVTSNLLRPSVWRHALAAIRSLRSRRYDVVISLYGRTASVMALLSKARVRAGYEDEAYPSTLDRPIASGRMSGGQRLHDSEYGSGIIASLFPQARHEMQWAPLLEVQHSAAQRVDLMLESAGIHKGDHVVAMHAGAHNGEFKRWPAAYHAQVAKRLSQSGAQIVVIGSSTESDLGNEIARESNATSLVGRTSLPEMVALLQRCRLIISGDSGPLHVAAAMGTPAIGIYGPTDPEVNGPQSWAGQDITTLRHDIACSPCYSVRTRAECPLGDPICMRLVTPTAVFDAALRILGLDQAEA